MDEFSHITQLLHASKPEEAISGAREVLKRNQLTQADKAETYYLMGNAYRQLNDFKEAMNCYIIIIDHYCSWSIFDRLQRR